jgi:hypothetical protein
MHLIRPRHQRHQRLPLHLVPGLRGVRAEVLRPNAPRERHVPPAAGALRLRDVRAHQIAFGDLLRAGDGGAHVELRGIQLRAVVQPVHARLQIGFVHAPMLRRRAAGPEHATHVRDQPANIASGEMEGTLADLAEDTEKRHVIS